MFWFFSNIAIAQKMKSDTIITLPDTTLANQYFLKGKQFLNVSKYDSAFYAFQKARDLYGAAAEKYDFEKKSEINYDEDNKNNNNVKNEKIFPIPFLVEKCIQKLKEDDGIQGLKG